MPDVSLREAVESAIAALKACGEMPQDAQMIEESVLYRQIDNTIHLWIEFTVGPPMTLEFTLNPVFH